MAASVDSDGKITFSSGHEFDPNEGIVGLSHDREVGDGYDAMVYSVKDGSNHMFGPLSPSDMAELADLMVERWQKFKATLPKT